MNDNDNDDNEQLLQDFKQHLITLNRSKQTISGYIGNLRKYFIYISEQGIGVVEADCEDLENYQGYLLNKHCIRTTDIYMQAVRIFYRYLLREKLILISPTTDLPPLRLPQTLPRNVLSESEITALLNEPDTKDDAGILHRAILELFYSGGLRLGEVCKLKVPDVDTARGFVKIIQGKGGKDRNIPIGHTCCLWIRAYRELVRPKVVNEKSGDYLFLGCKEGKPIQPLIVANMVRRYARKAKIHKRISCHTLRHTCSCHLLKNGMSLLNIGELLGHKMITTTQKYTKITQQDLIQAHKRFHPRERKRR